MFSEKAEEILLCLLNMSSFSLAQRFVGCQNQGTRNRQQRSRAGRTWAWSPSGCITAAWAELSRHTSSDPGSRDRGGHELMGSTSADTLPTWSRSRWGRFETPLLEARWVCSFPVTPISLCLHPPGAHGPGLCPRVIWGHGEAPEDDWELLPCWGDLPSFVGMCSRGGGTVSPGPRGRGSQVPPGGGVGISVGAS